MGISIKVRDGYTCAEAAWSSLLEPWKGDPRRVSQLPGQVLEAPGYGRRASVGIT